MKKIINRFCCFIIALFSSFVFIENEINLFPVSALTNSEITAKLTSLQSKYPQGSTWLDPGTLKYGGYQCYAFARQLAVDIFGTYPATNIVKTAEGTISNGWTAIRTASKVTLEPGDIIRADNDAHTAMIWKIEGNNVYVAQCWGSQNNKINWGAFWGNNKKATISELLGSGFNGVWKHPNSDPVKCDIQISGFQNPAQGYKHTPGKSCGLYGTITSNHPLKHVWGGVYKMDGTIAPGKSTVCDDCPTSTSYSLRGKFNDTVVFGDIPEGNYYFSLNAEDNDGFKKELIHNTFTVGNPKPKPSTPTFSVAKTAYMVGDKITFSFSASNAEGFTIGIDDAAGKRLITDTTSNSSYSVSTLASGNYSAYVTATNSSGYADSQRVYFSVGVTVTYDANGGTCSPTSQRVVKGDKYTGLPTNASRTGYTFAGWYTGKTDGSQVTANTVITSGSNHTLYAHWTQQNVTITLDGNGGTVTKTSFSVPVGSKLDALNSITASRTGYTFAGWFTDKSSGTQVKATDTASKSMTLYAHWTPKSVNVTFYRNQNSSDTSTAQETFTYGVDKQKFGYKTDGTGRYSQMNDASVGFGNWTKTGYSMLGWNENKTATESAYSTYSGVNNDWIMSKSPSAALYAVWKANTYNVKLVYNDGTDKTETVKVTYDGTYGLKDATRDGYNFNGWYTDASAGTQITANSKVAITADQTLYAHWSKNKIMLTFDALGGQSEADTKTVVYDSKYSILPNATKEGYIFDGWYLDKEYKNRITEDTIVKITANTTVYAKWTRIKVTIIFDGNGGVPEVEQRTVVGGNAYGALPAASLDGKTFVGWFTEDGKQITSDMIVGTQETMTLYAKWSVKGDVNESGETDVSDAVLLARLLAQDSEAVVSSQGKLNADTNNDGSLTSNDVILILKYIARIITVF